MTGQKDWVAGRICAYNIGYYIVWSTKYRRKVLEGPMASRLKTLFHDIASQFEFDIKSMEVMPDHCHVFVTCHPKKAPSDIVKCLKGISARILFMEYPDIKNKLWRGHLWNTSYYIGTVGDISKGTVLKYIEQQKIRE